MAGGKLSPRQKMINMMYLVLTALLALNVSKEVLDAFIVVNEGMVVQRGNIERKNNLSLNDFEELKILYNKPEQKEYYEKTIKPWYDKALEVNKMANELVEYIENMKAELVAEAEGIPKEDVLQGKFNLFELGAKDNVEIPAQYFGTANPPGTNGRANELKKKLEEFRETLLSTKFLKDTKDTSRFKFNLNTGKQFDFREKREVEWEMYYFYHFPLAEQLVELSKWQNNVRDAEGQMLRYLYEKVASNSFKFDAVKAAIIPKSNVVFEGNPFEAEIFLAAYNTTKNPDIILQSGGSITEYKDGRGIFKQTASGEGEKTVKGVIRIVDPATGLTREEPFETKYQVAKPMMTVTPDKMNVFYRGLENPVTISVPGVAPSAVSATCEGCAEFRSVGNGKYIVKPGQGNEAKITVSAKLDEKRVQQMGTAKFRIKRIPDPTIKFAGKESGDVLTAAEASASGAVIPMLKDFDFEVFAKIQGFTVSFDPGTGSIRDYQVSGNVIPQDVLAQIRKIPKGKKLYFDNITVLMPDNTKRTAFAVYTIK